MVPVPRKGHTVDPVETVGREQRTAAAAVVAEAVALALESAAAEAAEAVLVTAAAVTEAAGRAAIAAEKAKGARAFAAQAAAQSVAQEAERTAVHVQEVADLAARHVQRAASLAAEELARAVAAGTVPSVQRLALLLEATVRAAARATAQDTSRAADAVRSADFAAAAQVAERVAAGEDVVEREVIATALAQHELATAAAAAVAAETQARAAGAMTAAREAAAALFSHGQRANGTELGTTDQERVSAISPPRVQVPRRAQLDRILSAAEDRDARAQARDRVADDREGADSLRSFLGNHQPDAEGRYAASLSARRAAAMDRGEAMHDRTSAASDRAELTGALPEDATATMTVGTGDSPLSASPTRTPRVPVDLDGDRVEVLQAALRRSQDRLRFLVDAVSQYAIITLTPDGIIESWNTGAERLKGYTPREALGRHFSIFYTAEDRDAGLPQVMLDRARAVGSHEETGWRVRSDGSQFWADIIISAAHDDAGNLTGYVKVVRDLTDQHRLEVAQDSFYNTFEHDFAVPVAAIKGFTELIKDADAQDHDFLAERVDSNADRLLVMVAELVDYARLRSGPTPISLDVVDLGALVRHTVDDLASMNRTSRVHVVAPASLKVLADPVALERVLANLLTNAFKYSLAGSDINISCERAHGAGVLRIVDQGRGIDDRDLSSIFLEFERGRLAQEDTGTGLGLASVKRLVELQGGAVAITSRVGVGTTVTIRLPLAP
ncbi:MAG: hypothetical protein JWR90_2384 [Marmoricola sp.]|nr:hypothetical protein [Marmoricola sp.]